MTVIAERAEFGEVSFARLHRHQVVDRVFASMAESRGGWIVTLNTSILRQSQRERSLRRLHETAELIVPDGVPLLWAARLRGIPFPDRVAGSDLVWLLAERAAQEGRSLYLLGGNPGVAERAAACLTERYPALQIAGWSSPWLPPVPSAEDCAPIAEELARVEPDLVYVAVGSPKADYLIAQIRARLPRTWMIGVGISLSFITGEVRRAPAWMQKWGLEWLHRLWQEPRRLTRRYLTEDFPFAVRLLASSCAARFRT